MMMYKKKDGLYVEVLLQKKPIVVMMIVQSSFCLFGRVGNY